MDRKVENCSIDFSDNKLIKALKNILIERNRFKESNGIRLFINYSPVYYTVRKQSGESKNVNVKLAVKQENIKSYKLLVYASLSGADTVYFLEDSRDMRLNKYFFTGKALNVDFTDTVLKDDNFIIHYSGRFNFINIIQEQYQNLIEGFYLSGPRTSNIKFGDKIFTREDCANIFNKFEREFIRIYFKVTGENIERSIMNTVTCCLYRIIPGCFLLMHNSDDFIHPILDVEHRRKQFESLKIYEETKMFTETEYRRKDVMYIFSTYASLYDSTDLDTFAKIDHLLAFKILLGYICNCTYVDPDSSSNDILTINPSNPTIYENLSLKLPNGKNVLLDELTVEELNAKSTSNPLNAIYRLNVSDEIKNQIPKMTFLSKNSIKQEPNNQDFLDEEGEIDL